MRTIQVVFIENLKRIRTDRNLSQIRLAELADVSPGMVGDIETGRRNPTLTTIEKIALALGVPVHQLFFDTRACMPLTDMKSRDAKVKYLHELIDELYKT